MKDVPYRCDAIKDKMRCEASRLRRLGVPAANGGLSVLSAEGEGKAGVVELLLPDGVAGLGRAAGVEAIRAAEGEVTVSVDSEAGALGVPGSGLSAGGVTDVAAAHAGAVDPELLVGSTVGVQVGGAVLADAEGGEVLLVAGVAGSVLGVADPELATVGRDAGVVDGRARVDGNTTEEGVGGGSRGSGGSASSGENGDSGLGEHFGGCWRIERKSSKWVEECCSGVDVESWLLDDVR